MSEDGKILIAREEDPDLYAYAEKVAAMCDGYPMQAVRNAVIYAAALLITRAVPAEEQQDSANYFVAQLHHNLIHQSKRDVAA